MPLRAQRLRPGDTVGIISPSWGGAAQFPHRITRGIDQLHALGFKTKLGAHALNSTGAVSDTAENRAADIHVFLRDPEVRLILAAIGGDHSCHLLPHLDFQLVKSQPKLFMGFSDVTVLNIAIWSATKLVTFNGYSDQEKAALDEVLLERTKRYAFPIVSGMDFGHTAPQLTLPIGCRARIDTTAESVVVLEAAVA